MKINPNFLIVAMLMGLFSTNPTHDEVIYNFAKINLNWLKQQDSMKKEYYINDELMSAKLDAQIISKVSYEIRKAERAQRLNIHNYLLFTYINFNQKYNDSFYYITFLNLEFTNFETSIDTYSNLQK